MYNYGLTSFLDAKHLNYKEAINAFLKHQGVTEFTAKHRYKVNDYIEENWVRFASFIDKSIKNGTLKGEAVKLNTYYAEQKERNAIVKAEFERANLSDDQKKLLKYIGLNFGPRGITSFLMKRGYGVPAKTRHYTSKTLQWLPVVDLSIELGIDVDALLTGTSTKN